MNRAAFLARVRDALGRAEGDPVAPPPPPAAAHVVAPSMAGVGRAAVLDRFLERCAANGVEVRRAPDVAAAVSLAAAWLRELGVSAIADATPLAASVVAASGLAPAAAAAAPAAAAVDVGVTRAWRGVAETGTVVLRSEDGRLAGLLPPVHLVLLAAEDLRPGLTELVADVTAQGGPPAALVQVTGPSRTADIEVTLVTGVHGPGTVVIVLIG